MTEQQLTQAVQHDFVVISRLVVKPVVVRFLRPVKSQSLCRLPSSRLAPSDSEGHAFESHRAYQANPPETLRFRGVLLFSLLCFIVRKRGNLPILGSNGSIHPSRYSIPMSAACFWQAATNPVRSREPRRYLSASPCKASS